MSLTNALPSLGVAVLFGYVFVPVFFPSAWWVLILMTIFFFWTKMTETIVTTPGNLPSIYQCYYKAFSCCRRPKLDEDEKVPKISANAVNVLFSYGNIRRIDTFTDEVIQRDSLPPALRDILDASIDATENPTTTDAHGNIIPAPAPLKEVAAINASSNRNMPSAFYLIPTFNMELSVLVFAYFPLSVWAAKLVKSDMTVFFNVHRGVAFTFSTRVASSAIRGDALEVDLVTEILTDMENLGEEALESKGKEEAEAKEETTAETVVADEAAEEEDKNAEVTPEAATDATASGAGTPAQPAKPAPQRLHRRRPRPPRPITRVLVATIVNTYSFPGAAPKASSVLQAATDYFGADAAKSGDVSGDKMSAAAAASAAFASSSTHVKASYAFYPEHISAFANSSGNIHPRHLSRGIAKLFGEKGGVIDPMMLQTTFLRLLNDLNPSGCGVKCISAENPLAVDLGLPYRAIMEVQPEAQALSTPSMVHMDLRKAVDAPEVVHRSYVAPAAGIPECLDAFPQFNKVMYGTVSASVGTVAKMAVLFDKK